MKIRFIIMLIPAFIHAQEMPLFQEFTYNQPEVKVKQEVYLGDKMLQQAKGSYKPCIIPKVTKIVQKRLYSVEYRANEAMCKMKQSSKDYYPQYDNYRQQGVSSILPVRVSGKGNNITLKYCSLGLCAGKQKFTNNELDVTDRYFTISANTFQQSIEYAGKSGTKLNFTYAEYKELITLLDSQLIFR